MLNEDDDWEADPDYDPDDPDGDDDDRPTRATPLRRANFASDAAFATAKSARQKANQAARYQLNKDAVKAKSKAAYATLTPAARKTRVSTKYARDHAGATPVHRTQPAAARRHGIDVAPPATLVIHADKAVSYDELARLALLAREPLPGNTNLGITRIVLATLPAASATPIKP